MNKVFIIAEVGVNHNGSLQTAKTMVDKAIEANCDAVKFQTFKSENLVSKSAKKANYQIQNTAEKEEYQLDMLRKLELSHEKFVKLFDYCKTKNIQFLSTPFDLDSIEFLAELGMMTFKIPSGEITNLPYLRKINSYKRDVILSTGMSTIPEIREALSLLKNCRITLLHANTEYPTPMEDANLRAIQTLSKEFSIPVGYSDHTLGIEATIAAVALGASVIEKHFTLDKNMSGPDHLASLEPKELCEMVKSIRNIELAMGTGVKVPSKSEAKNIGIARKSIVAKCVIKKGEIFTEENITVKRPGNGISPMKWDDIIGQKSKKDYEEDELI